MGFKPEDAYTTELQAILHIAQTLTGIVAGASHQPIVSPITDCLHAVVNPVKLPSPDPLLPSLLQAGFRCEAAVLISEKHQLRAEELRQRIQESVVQACYNLERLPVITSASPLEVLKRKLEFTAMELYSRRLTQWKEEIIQRFRQSPKVPTQATSGNSRNFNQEYVPLLEHFFRENPFPTHAEKTFLARKSNMRYRQIHVWFQNRRNRSKKEGEIPRKKPIHEGPTRRLGEPYERMRDRVVNTNPQASEVNSTEEIIKMRAPQNNTPKDPFASAPPHAFPSSYPPTCQYDPFPFKKSLVPFSKPVWRRILDRKSPLPLSTSVDELVERFSHLSVRDEARSKESSKIHSHAATVAITVVPSRAPHPSLIACRYRQPTAIVQHHSSICVPDTTSKTFRNPSPTSKPVTLMDFLTPLNQGERPNKRRTAPLPQHFPGQTQNACRDTSPTERSSTSPSPRLFSPYSGSRRSFSSVSSRSTVSDVTDIQELPQSFEPPC